MRPSPLFPPPPAQPPNFVHHVFVGGSVLDGVEKVQHNYYVDVEGRVEEDPMPQLFLTPIIIRNARKLRPRPPRNERRLLHYEEGYEEFYWEDHEDDERLLKSSLTLFLLYKD